MRKLLFKVIRLLDKDKKDIYSYVLNFVWKKDIFFLQKVYLYKLYNKPDFGTTKTIFSFNLFTTTDCALCGRFIETEKVKSFHFTNKHG